MDFDYDREYTYECTAAFDQEELRETIRLKVTPDDLNKDIKERVRALYNTVVGSVDPKGFILGHLFAKHVITSQRMNEINSSEKNRRSMSGIAQIILVYPAMSSLGFAHT